MTHSKRLYEKSLRRKHLKANAKAKERERLRTASIQRTVDKYQRAMKHKGKGRAHKVKGETMPTMLCANSRCPKSWKHFGGKPMRGESMKVAVIWQLT